VLQDDDGHVLTSVVGIEPGQGVSVRVVDGRVLATTTSTRPEESP